MSTHKKLGILGPDPHDGDDYRLAEVQEKEIDLPNIFLLRDKMTSVQDQLYGDCFPKGTPVLMANGEEKPIEDVRCWEKVYTHKGKAKPVTKTYKRFAKWVHKISFRGAPDIMATEEHPFWCRPLIENDKEKESIDSNLEESQFVEVKDLKRGDFVGIPLIDDSQEPSKDILKNKDFLRLLGYYLAEGSLEACNKDCKPQDTKEKNFQRISFSLNIEEEEFAQDIKRISSELLKKEVTMQDRPEKNVRVVRLYAPILADYIYELCGKGASEKRLSSELMRLKPELQKEILMGWFRGDGYKKERRRVGITVSKELARQLWFIGIRNGIKMNIRKHSYVGPNRQQAYDVTWMEDEKTRKKFIDNGYLWVRVLGTEKKKLRQNVYNLEVKDHNSYVAKGFAVHNCTSHAADGVKEFQDSQEYDKEIKLSQRFVYHHIKKISGMWDTEGDFLRNGFKALQKYGACLEETYPYVKKDDWKDYAKPEPPEEAKKEAEKYKIKEYWRVDTNLDDIRSAIYKNEVPLGISMGWYKSYYSEEDDGYLPVPGDHKYGGHALNCVGWENDKLWFRNSHGEDYGYQGYFYIPFDEFDKHEIWDAWASIDEIEKQDTGWVADSYLKVLDEFTTGTRVTPTYQLNFREEPWGDKIDLVKPGDTLKIMGESQDSGGFSWQKVKIIR